MSLPKDEKIPTAWCLTELYEGLDDPRIFSDLQRARSKAFKIADLYRGKIRKYLHTPQLILSAIKDYERIHIIGMKPYLYATLLFASNTQNDSIASFFAA